MNIRRRLTAISLVALVLTLRAPAHADLLDATASGTLSPDTSANFSLTSKQSGPGASFSSSSAIVTPTMPFTLVEGPCLGVLCVQHTIHEVVGPGLSMSLSGNLDAFMPPPCFSPVFGFICVREEELRGTVIIDDFVITSADPTVRVVETSFNALVTGSVFVFAINPGTEANAHVFLTFMAADCSDSSSSSYEQCVRGQGSLIQVGQNNQLVLDARNTTIPLSTVFGSGAFAPLSEPGTSLATTFTIPVDMSVTSPRFFAPVGRPFSIGLGVDALTQVFTNPNVPPASPVFGRASIDFGDPISLPTTGPVLNLPAGFTVNSLRAGVVNNRFVGAGAPPDTTPPTTSAVPSLAPNANGWNNTNITVALSATDDPGGSGVREIHFSLSGAQSGAGLANGSVASVPVSAEGITTLTYFAVDNAGNQEAAKTLVVRVDKTPPTLTCGVSPGQLWPPNHKMVPVTASVTQTDALSGPAGFALASITSNEGDPAADIQGFVAGAASLSGDLLAERLGDGTGRVYTLIYSGRDLAGNSATCTTTVLVPHDRR